MTSKSLSKTLDWLSRTYLFSDMPGRSMLEPLRQKAMALKAKLFPKKDYKIETFRLSSTNICNAACCFCSYPQTKMAHNVLPMSTLRSAIPLIKSTGQYAVDLTPAVGDPLVDAGLEDKVRLLIFEGYKVTFTTNGILLDKHMHWILELAKHFTCLYFSLGDFDRATYYIQYGKDKGERVFQNLCQLLQHNEALGQPLTIRLQVRNREHPNHTKRSADYGVLKKYLHGKVSIHFTPFWDNMSGEVDFATWSNYMLKRLRKPIKSNKPCSQLRSAIVLADGGIRLCGCRVLKDEHDGLVVGKVGDNLNTLNTNATKIRDGFYRNERPTVCQTCSLYSPE